MCVCNMLHEWRGAPDGWRTNVRCGGLTNQVTGDVKMECEGQDALSLLCYVAVEQLVDSDPQMYVLALPPQTPSPEAMDLSLCQSFCVLPQS